MSLVTRQPSLSIRPEQLLSTPPPTPRRSGSRVRPYPAHQDEAAREARPRAGEASRVIRRAAVGRQEPPRRILAAPADGAVGRRRVLASSISEPAPRVSSRAVAPR